MQRYTIVVRYADGSRSALGAYAVSIGDARQEIISRLAEQCIEWPPHFSPQDLTSESEVSHAAYCPACFDNPHSAVCPNLTGTGHA